jgi:hypothetical protein
MSQQMKMGEKYSSFKKTVGPPNYQFNPRYDPIEHNEYLQKKGIPVEEVKMFKPHPRIADDHHDSHH